jgi:lycopene cyclase domain-containing protein
MTYLWLNLVFAALAMIAALVFARETNVRSVWLTGLSVVVITIVGDSFIVASGIVDYDLTKILGLRVGFAPVEDFAYAIVAVALVPVIWNSIAKRK